jgi:hypothetical protein
MGRVDIFDYIEQFHNLGRRRHLQMLNRCIYSTQMASDQEGPVVIDPCHEKPSASATQPGVARQTKIAACRYDELADAV